MIGLGQEPYGESSPPPAVPKQAVRQSIGFCRKLLVGLEVLQRLPRGLPLRGQGLRVAFSYFEAFAQLCSTQAASGGNRWAGRVQVLQRSRLESSLLVSYTAS